LVGNQTSQRTKFYPSEELIFFSSTHRLKTSTLGKDGQFYPNSTSKTLNLVEKLGLKSALIYSTPELIEKTYEFTEEIQRVQAMNRDIVVYVEKFFRNDTTNTGIFKMLTRRNSLLSLFKEKIH
jgi:hypothetical protein